MSIDPHFGTASSAIESAVHDVAGAHHFFRIGQATVACGLLLSASHKGWRFEAVIMAAKPELDAVSDVRSCYHGPDGARCYGNAHEAVLGRLGRIWIELLSQQGIALTNWEAIASQLFAQREDLLRLPVPEVTAHIQRERARVLTRAAAAGESSGQKAAGGEQPTGQHGARKKKRRRASEPKVVPITPEQTEAVQLVGEHKGNIAAAARAAGKSRWAMQKLYDKALKKLGKAAPVKPKTRRLPRDRRGQECVEDHSGNES